MTHGANLLLTHLPAVAAEITGWHIDEIVAIEPNMTRDTFTVRRWDDETAEIDALDVFRRVAGKDD